MSSAARRTLVALAALVVLLTAAGCLDLPERNQRAAAPGAEAVTVRASDDRPLDARLWVRDRRRLVIYLHEYHRTQRDWWPEAAAGVAGDPSALTLDLRGHGDSGGDHQDFGFMADDVRVVVAFARARGYERIAIVGAGMGGTVAALVAREEPDVSVVGLSLPADFADLEALEACAAIGPRLTIVAAREDLSARESLEQITRNAHLDPSRALLLPGRAHGIALLRGESEVATRRLTKDALDRAWR